MLLAITLALYGTSVYFNFVWDDFDYIRDNPLTFDWSWSGLRLIWSSNHMGHYAPVLITFLSFIRSLVGLNPFWFHVAQLGVHAGCCLLLYGLLSRMESPRIAFIVALLFAVHPANIETVAWISELKSTLAFLFFLLSFWCFVRFRSSGHWVAGVLAGLFLILSLLSKINTVVAPAIFLLYDYRQGVDLKTLRWKSLVAYFLISGLMTFIHLRAFHGNADAMRSDYYHGLGLHIFGIPSILAFYFQMIIFPHPLAAWQMFPAPDEHIWVNVLGWIGLLAMAWLLTRSSCNVQFWFLWILIFLAPVMQLIPFGIWVADRYLYIPAIGGFVLTAHAFYWLLARMRAVPQRRWADAALSCVLLVMGWRTIDHLPVWKHNVTLWADTIPHCNTSAYCHSAYGLALQEAGLIQEGGDELAKSVRMDPSSEVFLVYFADSLTLIARNYDTALQAYQEAIRIAREQVAKREHPRFTLPAIYARQTRAYIYAGQYENARRSLQEGLSVGPSDPGLLAMQALLQWKVGDMTQARSSIQSLRVALDDQASPVPRLVGRYWGDRAQIFGFLRDLGGA